MSEVCIKCDGTGVSALRRAIQAPEGHVIVVRDLSAIEARVNAWLAGQDDMIETFRRGEDVYCEMYQSISGRVITKKDKNERFLGKTIVLGCIAEGQRVLALDAGHAQQVPIEKVTRGMKLWDGDDWVDHGGVVFQGKKKCISRRGLVATFDHKVLTHPFGPFEEFHKAKTLVASFSHPQHARIIDAGYIKAYGELNTYDILNCGPNNRFTAGGFIVHNCGYGLGWRKFQSMLRVGMLGDKGRLLGWEIAEPLGVYLEGFLSKNIGYVQESLPPGVELWAHGLHCACAAQIIKAFRDNKPMIPKMWQSCQEALGYVLRGEEHYFGKNDLIKTCKEGFVLPNGMIIRYTNLEAKQEGRRTEYKILKNARKGEWGKVYGGLCTENLVQALSRIILTDNMLKMKAEGLRVAHQVHDEILVVTLEEKAEGVYHRMGQIMSAPPIWAPDLPLASEGGWNRQYIK